MIGRHGSEVRTQAGRTGSLVTIASADRSRNRAAMTGDSAAPADWDPNRR